MEPTGTYGDVLRQALFDAGIRTERVSPKVAHDYAEVFDGVPSQFDGKDAAVVAELAALGKSQEWKYEDAQRCRPGDGLLGGLDGCPAAASSDVAWPTGGALGASLAGGHTVAEAVVGDVDADPQALWRSARGWPTILQAVARVTRWGGRYMAAEKIRGLVASARETVGVRQGRIDVRRMQAVRRDGVGGSRETCAEASVGWRSWRVGTRSFRHKHAR